MIHPTKPTLAAAVSFKQSSNFANIPPKTLKYA